MSLCIYIYTYIYMHICQAGGSPNNFPLDLLLSFCQLTALSLTFHSLHNKTISVFPKRRMQGLGIVRGN